MYRPNFSKDVLMSYILDIEKEMQMITFNISEKNYVDNIYTLIKYLKEYIREG